MGERVHWVLNRPYGYDEDFWFRYGKNGEHALTPCEVIEDKKMCLGIIGNSALRPDQLLVSSRDRETIKVTIPETGNTIEFTMPGKSALIVLEPNICDRSLTDKIVKIDLLGEPDRHDHLYATSVGEIELAGWKAYWTPLQLYPTRLAHVRIVSQHTIESGEDPTIEEATRLREVFTKVS